MSKENILTTNSRPRSKRLAEVLQKTGLIERSGQGVDKMIYLCFMESKKLQREGLIKSQSSADRKFVLGDLYYEIAKQPAYIKEYRAKDLQIVAGCFEKAKEVSMKEFVDIFDRQLSRGQIKYLILKLEEEGLIVKEGLGRWSVYKLSEKIDKEKNIMTQFQFAIEH